MYLDVISGAYCEVLSAHRMRDARPSVGFNASSLGSALIQNLLGSKTLVQASKQSLGTASNGVGGTSLPVAPEAQGT